MYDAVKCAYMTRYKCTILVAISHLLKVADRDITAVSRTPARVSLMFSR